MILKKMLRIIKFYGLWTSSLLLAAILSAANSLGADLHPRGVLIIIIMVLIPSGLITIHNWQLRLRGKTDYNWLPNVDDLKNPAYSRALHKAKYPTIDKRLLFNLPTGIVLGKFKHHYVCKPVAEDGHVLIIGGSGSGKTSTVILDTILAAGMVDKETIHSTLLMKNASRTGPAIFCLDPKGEIHQKATKRGDATISVIDPQDRRSCGWNPFYMLNGQSSEQDVLETIQDIVFALLPLRADIKDPFWILSAQNLLTGLMLHHYQDGKKNLIDIIDSILATPTKEQIEQILAVSDEYSRVSRYLVSFKSMADETLGGIVGQMHTAIVLFSNDSDLRYAFRENPRKATPRLLEEGKSIYLAIREEKLEAYSGVLRLCINQVLASLEKRPEGSNPVIVMIDELPRILSTGKIPRLLDAARTLRSRQVTLILVTQSLEALQIAYSRPEMTDLVSNCSFKCILSSSSPETSQMIVNWVGKYRVARYGSTYSSISHSSTNTSYEDRPILEPTDLITLPQSGDAIIVSDYGYFRVRKAPYYKDSILSKEASNIDAYNNAIDNIYADYSYTNK